MSNFMKLAKELQLLAHKHGYENFRDAVAQALIDASLDTEDLSDRSISERYRYLFNAVNEAAINEPEFIQEEE